MIRKSNGLDPDQDRHTGFKLFAKVINSKIMSPLARREFIPVGPLVVGSKEGVTVLE